MPTYSIRCLLARIPQEDQILVFLSGLYRAGRMDIVERTDLRESLSRGEITDDTVRSLGVGPADLVLIARAVGTAAKEYQRARRREWNESRALRNMCNRGSPSRSSARPGPRPDRLRELASREPPALPSETTERLERRELVQVALEQLTDLERSVVIYRVQPRSQKPPQHVFLRATGINRADFEKIFRAALKRLLALAVDCGLDDREANSRS